MWLFIIDTPKGTSLRKSPSFKLSTVKIRRGVWHVGELTESVTNTHRDRQTHKLALQIYILSIHNIGQTINDKHNCTNMPFHAENDNEGYWHIGETLNHWHAEFTWGRDYREESINDTVLWWLVSPSVIITSWKYNSELQRQTLEAQKHQFLRVKQAVEL